MAFIFDVKVFPGSKKRGWFLDKTGNLKCYLKNVAEHGKANDELIKNLSKALGVSLDMISISSGMQSRKKRIKIDIEMSYNKLLELLGIDWQSDMFS
ncbi:MAG TPA: DUF167 domain-containing protein [Candidatus Babeliales bacterium]|nr:DUF167 domain-containing protein [Candidatus Babeliales bacterium]